MRAFEEVVGCMDGGERELLMREWVNDKGEKFGVKWDELMETVEAPLFQGLDAIDEMLLGRDGGDGEESGEGEEVVE